MSKITIFDKMKDQPGQQHKIRIDYPDGTRRTIPCYTYHYMGEPPDLMMQLLDKEYHTIDFIDHIDEITYGGKIKGWFGKE